MGCLRDAIAESEHRVSAASLAQFLEDGLGGKDIHLDITGSLDWQSGIRLTARQ